MEQKLTQHIIEKYKPLAVLLHGSRASGNERLHSDWDFVILVNEKIETEREVVDGQNIEIRVLVVPIPELNDQNKSPWIVLREGNVKVLFDPNNIAKDVIDIVTAFYKIPPHFSETDISSHKAWYRSQLDGMIDYKDEQEAFFRKLSELYPRVIMYWFHFVRHTYMPQVYYSIPIIKEEDPTYFELLEKLASNISNQEKIDIAEKVYQKLWK
jgi:predicted nucleotidyltransferase